MSRAVPRKKIQSALLRGIRDAVLSHRKMSVRSKRSFTKVPEYFVTTKIGDRLAKVAEGCSVELEMSVRDTLEKAKASQPGKTPSELEGSKRFDLVLWWKSTNTPRMIVEVKHEVRGFGPPLEKDIRRICSALRYAATNSRLEMGYIAFFLHTSAQVKSQKQAEEKIKGATQRLEQKAKTFVDNYKKGVCTVKLLTDPSMVHVTSENRIRWGKACCLQLKRRTEPGRDSGA